MDNLKERLALEAELLERIDENREKPGCEELSADLEREIIERELNEIARASQTEPSLVLLRRSHHSR